MKHFMRNNYFSSFKKLANIILLCVCQFSSDYVWMNELYLVKLSDFDIDGDERIHDTSAFPILHEFLLDTLLII